MHRKVIVKYASLFGESKGPRQYEIAIPSSGNDKEDLNTVFRYMNHVDGDPDGVESQLLAIKERSLSVGDGCILDGVEYVCQSVGWEKVTESTVRTGDRNVCKHCGQVIEFTGMYWRHMQASMRHPAEPKITIAEGNKPS